MTDVAGAPVQAPGPGPGGPAVRTNGLTKRFGSLVAVASVDLEVPRGAIYGLIGPNGAGKTTTFAMLASLVRPDAGTIDVLGFDPVTEPASVRERLGFMPDVLGVYDGLRVDEYLQFFASAYRIPHTRWHDLVGGLLELVDLEPQRAAMVNSLSRGMKQRLSLARALVHDPELLILDEPASGLDPRARVDLRSLLLDLQRLGKTIIISSHILPELQEVCSDVGILEHGRLLAAGPPAEIVRRLGGARQVVVRLADGTELRHDVADHEEQAALLRRLVVDDGLPVVEFVEERAGLEELFLAITESGDR